MDVVQTCAFFSCLAVPAAGPVSVRIQRCVFCVASLHPRPIVSVTRVYRVGVWFGFVRSALLLAVVT